MGNPLFGIDIAKLIHDNMSSGLLVATLTKVAPTTRTAGQLTGGRNPTTTDYACRGFIDRKNRKTQDGELTRDGTMTIVLIGNSIDGGNTAPEIGDYVTIEGTVFSIDALDRDPAGATFTLTCTVS